MTAIEVLNIPCVKNFNIKQLTDAEGASLFFRATDLKARFFLNRVATEEWEAGNRSIVAPLIHGEMYLADRLAYALSPPPFPSAVRVDRL